MNIRDRKLEFDPVKKCEKIKIEKKLVSNIKEKDIESFFENCKQKAIYKERDLCIFYFLYYAGLRVSELTNIKIMDIDFSQGFVKVCGKRDKERIVPLNSKTLKETENYIQNERKTLDLKTSQYLFLSRRGDKLTRNMVWVLAKKYADSNFLENCFPHAFRHTFATMLLKNDVSINNIKDMLGHSSIATTQIYSNVVNNKLKSEYFRVFNDLC